MSDLLTVDHKKKMVDFMKDIIRGYRTSNVAEGLVEFTERKRVLVAGTSARPGKYRFNVTPYLREPAECLSDYSKVYELVIMKGTQVGGSDGLMMNHELYCLYYGIGGVQYVTSDDDLAQEHMEKRLDPMIEAAGLSHLITPPVKKKSNKSTGDTKRSKSYAGTFLRVTGSNSESKLSSLPSRILHIDECDKYRTLSGGGNPIEKAVRRTDSYGNLKKIVYISTPKEEATSLINPLFKQGDCRYYFIPCPRCGHMQKLVWSQIKWDKDENGDMIQEFDEDGNLINDPVYYECIECKGRIHNHEKVNFMKELGRGGKAEWRATKNPDHQGIRSYHISGLYGFRSWYSIATQFTKIKDDPELLQDFVNDTLGDVYKKTIDKPNESYLMSRCEKDWERGQINDNVMILTMGIDIHPSRIDYHLVGWGRNKESWSIDFDSLHGDIWEPLDPSWDKLEEILLKQYTRINGSIIPVHIALIDAQGRAAETVKAFCERFPYSENSINGVYPTLGKVNVVGVVKEHSSSIATPELLIDDQRLKAELYNNLKKRVPAIGERYPRGFMHFHSDYSEQFFSELTAEEVEEIQNSKGTHTEFIIHNKKQRANHVLDCTKMCLAGLYHMYFKYFKILNKNQKARRRKEIPASWDVFWNLFGDDTGDNEE